MDVEKMSSIDSCGKKNEDDDDVPLPGFRFHPTDEELVGFYLRRKVEKRPISLELIKHIDIYKYDPWDLPKGSNVGEKEWYFFCRRGRKYRNSIRPNRVTGSGFWKATGIDKPIYSEGRRGDSSIVIGLKKSLVYYRGSAGKGTKTDWMMHEFRLPPLDHRPLHQNNANHIHLDNDVSQEAEVWTLCRILKRNTSNRKCIPDWREISNTTTTRNRTNPVVDAASSKTCSVESDNRQAYNICFRTTPVTKHLHDDLKKKKKPVLVSSDLHVNIGSNNLVMAPGLASIYQAPSSGITSYSNFSSPEVNELPQYGNWDELRSIVEFAGGDTFFSY